MNNYKSGHWAELIALNYLRCCGYSLVCRNYQALRGTMAGEIDLIMRKGRTIVFVEVKKRSTLNNAAYAIQPRQQERIRYAAEAFLASHPQFAEFDIRFDAVLIAFPFKLKHLPDAF